MSKKNKNLSEYQRKFKSCRTSLLKLKKKHRDLDLLKSEFVAIASHRLRNPLSSIRWYFESLLSGDLGKLNQKQRNFLSEAYRSSWQMVNLLENLFRVAKIDASTVVISKESHSLEEIIEEVLAENFKNLKQKKIVLLWKKKNLPPLMLDRDKIKLAVSNIIDNAIKYNSFGGKIEIDVHEISRGKKRFLLSSIKDTGIGIPRHQTSRIFTKFFRAKNVITINTTGNGLSLYVTRSYIQSHGGRIWAESRLGKGTTICFILPMRNAQ